MYFYPEDQRVLKNHSEVRARLTHVMFPEHISDEMLAFHGVYPLQTTKPQVELPQVAKPSGVVLVDGGWVQQWQVVEATPEEIGTMTPPVPAVVSRRQARQALLLAGLLDHVPAAIASLDDGTPEGTKRMRLAQIEWEDALEFERGRPLVAQIAAAIGLDARALDQLFIAAAAM